MLSQAMQSPLFMFGRKARACHTTAGMQDYVSFQRLLISPRARALLQDSLYETACIHVQLMHGTAVSITSHKQQHLWAATMNLSRAHSLIRTESLSGKKAALSMLTAPQLR